MAIGPWVPTCVAKNYEVTKPGPDADKFKPANKRAVCRGFSSSLLDGVLARTLGEPKFDKWHTRLYDGGPREQEIHSPARVSAMDDDQEFRCWISKLAAGDEAAAQAVWEQYFDKVVRLARRKLEGMARRVVDEEDVALSALKSFVRGVERGRFPQLSDHDDLWRILVTIAARKAIAQRKRQLAQKRGGGEERGESVFATGNNEGRAGGIADVLGEEPTPEFQAMMAEQCEALLSRLEDSSLRDLALRKLEGYTNQEIAESLGCTARTIERWLSRIRDKWQTIS